MRSVLGACAALVGLHAAACYSPNPRAGSPCDGEHPCPSPLQCSPVTQTCETDPAMVDAPVIDPDGPIDTVTDSPIPDGPDGQAYCYGTGIVRVCFASEPMLDAVVTVDLTIDTATSPLCSTYTGNPPDAYCVLAFRSLKVENLRVVRAIGPRPIVVVATQGIEILGNLNAQSELGIRGAGSNPSTCPAATPAIGLGGGAGGSFGGVGGAGGTGGQGGIGATPGATSTATTLRGGCDGSVGGGNNVGPVGQGGGAVALISPAFIRLQGGRIRAYGSGAGRTGKDTGASGGGSGGMILLDAPSIAVDATSSIWANGGGGAEGGAGNDGNPGGVSPETRTAAPGGANNAGNGGDGGDGGAGASPNGQPGMAEGISGGGGGGAVGVVRVFPPQPLPFTSPPSS